MDKLATVFTQRKRDHIKLALDENNQTSHMCGFDAIAFMHEALPEINFHDITLDCTSLGHTLPTPFYVNSMTAGHEQAKAVNQHLANACAQTHWSMGVGSQRRELDDIAQGSEWEQIRASHPNIRLYANLGIAQVITTPLAKIQRIIDNLQASALFIHLNALQECLQAEGTPEFQGGLYAIDKLSRSLDIPILVKETGCGISVNTLQRLAQTNIRAVDISGLGGTHWGRIEGGRYSKQHPKQQASRTFANWGINTVACLQMANNHDWPFELWASGGVRSGLDSAKCLALGATQVGIAQPLLKPALENSDAVIEIMRQFELELKIALFCTGRANIHALKETPPWMNR